MAHQNRISNIQVASLPVPIEVRVIRRWKPFANGTKIAYLLVDKHGDAVQAMIEQAQDADLASAIKLMDCYRLEVYNCIGAPGMYKVALHPAALRIHSGTPFIPIQDDGGIPTTYYNFIPYDRVTERANVNKVLTDYIGMIYSIQFGEPGTRTPAIRLNLEDQSGNQIQVALWPEIADMLDIERLLASDYKLIAAVASVRVTTFFGRLQLESTSATRIEIEPEIEMARALRVMYHNRHPAADPNDISAQKIQVEGGPSEKNRTTISELLEQELAHHKGMTYTCDALLAAFTPGQSWRYPTCPICTKTMDAQGGGYVCAKDREQEPHYKYCIRGDLADGTGTLSVTIFDSPIAALLGISCDDMVRAHGNVDPMKIPKQIEALKNQQKIYQLNNVSKDYNDNLRFAVNRIFRAEVGEKRRAEASSGSEDTATKKLVVVQPGTTEKDVALVNTDIAGASSTTPQKLKNKIEDSVTTTPARAVASVSSTEPAEGKSPAIGSSHRPPIRQLFKDKDGGSGEAEQVD